MKRYFLTLLVAWPLLSTAQQTISISVTNPTKTERTDQPVVIGLSPYGEVRSALVTDNGQEIACQLDDIDLDETFDELCFLVEPVSMPRC